MARVKSTATPKAGVKRHMEKVKLLKVKAGMKYRGAREAWYNVLLAHDGKPVESFLKATTDKPPSVPKSGVVERPSGWLRFFERVGVASEVTG